jgi:S1-C subfamily serine protease
MAGMSESTLVQFSNGLADAVAAAAPAVVQVQGRRQPASGVVYAADVVLTTMRALGREDGLRVRTPDNRTIDAELAGWDPASHLAVLRVPGLDIAPPEVAAAPARVGHLALAVARSWSNALTASAGIVAVIGGPLPTGRGRSIDQVIRTTAPMHGGFAGGAFVDAGGHLLGISTAAEIRGLRVIIPAAIAWKAAADVLVHGRPRRGYLGVAGQAVQLGDRQRGPEGQERGLLIVGVVPASPAEAAGLLVGDILVTFDGEAITSPDGLLDRLTGDRIGRSLPVHVIRGGAGTDLTVQVGEKG